MCNGNRINNRFHRDISNAVWGARVMPLVTMQRFFPAHNSSEEINRLLDIPGMDLDLAEKYSEYIARKSRVKKTGRTNGSYRDSNRQKVYESEWAFQKQVEIKKFATFKDAERRMKQIMNSKLWKELAGGKFVYLEQKRDMGGRSRTAGRAHYGGKIDLCPSSGMDEYTLLHELAHQAGAMHHDVKFRKILLRLVSRFMGTEAASILRKEMRSRGLKLTLNTTVKSPEDWLKSYLKVSAARSAVNRSQVIDLDTVF